MRNPMALSKMALQRKREKKNKIRKIKTNQQFSMQIAYNQWPVYEAMIPANLWETGIGQVIISRKNQEGDISVGLYLVDVFCLGVKDCCIRLMDLEEYTDMLIGLQDSNGEILIVQPEIANTLIHKAVNFALKYALTPHKDFAKDQRFLKNIPMIETLEFPFGVDGKPFYVQGPNESIMEAKRIHRILENKLGREAFLKQVAIQDALRIEAVLEEELMEVTG